MLNCRFWVIFLILVQLLCVDNVFAKTIHSIRVEGNARVETPTILAHVDIEPNQNFNDDKLEDILKNLFATGLFADVVITQQGDELVIKVVENKIINRIIFEGNERIKEALFLSELGLRPREVYTAARAQEAAQKIRDIYRLSGRYGAKVVPKIIEREQNRIDLIFEIDEGKPTRISRIIFVGNKRFSERRLESIIMTKESRWYRFFTSDDNYDPDRLAYDRELLRRYYLENGYADFRVISVVAELDPDDRDFYITYTIEEGERYKFGDVKIDNQLPKLKVEELKDLITFKAGDWFNNRSVEKSIEILTNAIGEQGFAFVEIEPRLNRHPETQTLEVEFIIKEGKHVYINRINIIGNDRTDDDVIRREFRLVEGDAFNSAKLKRSEQRINNLGFFKKAEVTKEDTLAPDKMDITAKVEDKPTGSLQFAAGFSTADGPLGNIVMSEQNLMGKAYELYISAMVAQKATDFRVGFSNPYFLGKPLHTGIEVFHGSRKYDTRKTFSGGFRNTSTGSTLHMGYDITELLSQRWSYTIRRDFIDNLKTNPSMFLRQQQGRWVVSAFGHNLFYDKRDSRIDPTKGHYLGLGNEFAGAGGDVRYLKCGAHVGNYLPVDNDNKWIFVTKVAGGVMSGLGKNLRIVDKYSLGGDSLRGFADGGVGPRDISTGDALGGRAYYKGSVELKFPFGLPNEFGVRGSLFADVGSVWSSGDKSPTVRSDGPSPRVGLGVGVNWRSPFGPIGVSFAKAVVRKDGIDRTEVFRLNFGTTF